MLRMHITERASDGKKKQTTIYFIDENHLQSFLRGLSEQEQKDIDFIDTVKDK